MPGCASSSRPSAGLSCLQHAQLRARLSHQTRVPALIAEFLLAEADADALVRDKHDVVVAARELRIDELVAFLDLDGDDAAFADVREIGEVRFLHDARAGREKNVQVFVPRLVLRRRAGAGHLRLNAQGGGNLLAALEVDEANLSGSRN